jgi:hypothetical protein
VLQVVSYGAASVAIEAASRRNSTVSTRLVASVAVACSATERVVAIGPTAVPTAGNVPPGAV